MTPVSSPELDLAPPGEIDTRLTASPRFAPGVNHDDASDSKIAEPPDRAGKRADENAVNQAQVVASTEDAAEIAPFLALLGVNLEAARLGRKHVFDEFMRGRLVSLLAMGLSIRQSAAALGLSHVAVWKELKRNPKLEEQVNAARTQAQIEPLLVILRESKRSWRAATWVLKHLQEQMKQREETPDERQRRQREEHDEYRRRTQKETDEEFERRRKAGDKLVKERLREAQIAQLRREAAPYLNLSRKKKKPPADAK